MFKINILADVLVLIIEIVFKRNNPRNLKIDKQFQRTDGPILIIENIRFRKKNNSKCLSFRLFEVFLGKRYFFR